MFLITKHKQEADHMTHSVFILKMKEFQNLIEKSIEDDLSKKILMRFSLTN